MLNIFLYQNLVALEEEKPSGASKRCCVGGCRPWYVDDIDDVVSQSEVNPGFSFFFSLLVLQVIRWATYSCRAIIANCA